MKNEKGFTLIEMLIVLLIISVLILITIPNVTKHFSSIDEKGCAAYVQMVQGQVEAYKVDYLKYPTMQQLKEQGYIKKEAKCPNGNEITLDPLTGTVSEMVSSTSEDSEIGSEP